MHHGSQGWVGAGLEECVYCDDEAGLYAVADGIGAPRQRRAAARIFCESIRPFRDQFQEILSGPPNDPETRAKAMALMERAFDRAAGAIYRVAERKAGYAGMATTAVVLAVGPAGAVLGHVGDARAYLLRAGDVRRLTEDHNLIAKMAAEGLLGKGREVDPRSVLSRAVGHMPSVTVETLWLEVNEGDEVPLCSYGLYRSFTDGQLRDLLRGGMERAMRAAMTRPKEEAEVTGVLVRVAATDDTTDTTSKAELISRMDLFRHLGDQELLRVLKIVYERRLNAGDVLCNEGDGGDAIWIVFEGELSVVQGGTLLTTIGPGGHLGELAFMDGQARSATVAATKPTLVLTFKRDDFRPLIQRDPVLAAKVMWSFALNMGARIRDLTVRYADAQSR